MAKREKRGDEVTGLTGGEIDGQGRAGTGTDGAGEQEGAGDDRTDQVDQADGGGGSGDGGDEVDGVGRLGWARHRVRLNPARCGVLERVVIERAGPDGGDLVVGSGQVVTVSHEIWKRVKDLVDGQGRKYLVRG